MIRKFTMFAMLAFVLVGGAVAASAQSWVDLGTREVLDRADKDSWQVGKDKGEFKAIKLSVRERQVRFYSVEVKYENGRTEMFQVRNLINAGGQTRVLDLKGKDRFIDEVVIVYEASTARRGKRSHVTLWGLK